MAAATVCVGLEAVALAEIAVPPEAPAVRFDEALSPPRAPLGIGATMTVSGLVGGRATYGMGRVAFEVIAGAQFVDAGAAPSAFASGGGVGTFFVHKLHSDVALSVGGRTLATRIDSGIGHATQISVEAPVHLEWFFAERASIHIEFGPTLSIPFGDVSIAGGEVRSGDPRVSLTGSSAVGGGFTLFL